MELTELDQEKMKVVKEIADCNVILSGMKAEILKLREEKEQFIVDRANELEIRLWKFLNDSKELVAETNRNYVTVHNFYVELKEFADEVKIQRQETKDLIQEAKNKMVDLENLMVRKATELSQIRKGINNDLRVIERERNFIKAQKEEMQKERIKINNQLAEINISLTALKKK